MILQHCIVLILSKSNQIFLYSPYYAEACNELRGPSPRLSAWAAQLRRNVATVASRWRHCVDLTGPGVEPQTSRTDSVRFATELTAGCAHFVSLLNFGFEMKIRNCGFDIWDSDSIRNHLNRLWPSLVFPSS